MERGEIRGVDGAELTDVFAGGWHFWEDGERMYAEVCSFKVKFNIAIGVLCIFGNLFTLIVGESLVLVVYSAALLPNCHLLAVMRISYAYGRPGQQIHFYIRWSESQIQ